MAEIAVAFNHFPELAAVFLAGSIRLSHDAGQYMYETAVATSPVLTGAMRASHRLHDLDAEHWDVTVQEDEAQAGEKTYALFVNGGTIHMSAQPWLTNAAVATVAFVEEHAAAVLGGSAGA